MKVRNVVWTAGLMVLGIQGGPVASGAEAAIVAPPADARVIDFDDAAAPALFSQTQPLRNAYAPLGVTFEGGNALNGGAVLNMSTFQVTGESGTNALAFNVFGSLQNGGIPQPPEVMLFRHAVSRVQMNVAGLDGGTIEVGAYDEDGNSLGVENVVGTSAMQTVVLEYPRIAKIIVTTAGEVTVIDDLAFVLAPTIIDFDDVVAPDAFVETVTARNEYVGRGVRFQGGDTDDGGGILEEGGGWGITGFSPPNILAINNAFGAFKFGGNPVFPQYILFEPPAKMVRFKMGGSGGGTIHFDCYDTGGQPIGSLTSTVQTTMKTVAIAVPGTASVKISGDDVPFLAIDDLEYLVDGTLIDFDDATEAPGFFSQTTALRDRYEALGVTVEAPDNDGMAILNDDSDFGVTGFGPPNRLAWNVLAALNDGGVPRAPITLRFDPPIKRVEFLAGSLFGGKLSVEANNVLGESVGTSDIFLNDKMQSLALPAEGATELVINVPGTSTYGIIDNLAFRAVDPCEHDACYVGNELNRYCNTCVTKVCNENSECCNDGWTLACALAAESTCSLTCAPLCGDANDDRKVTAPDALNALRTAVGAGTCPLFRCDYNGDTKVTAADALQILRRAVGQTPTAKCPAAP